MQRAMQKLDAVSRWTHCDLVVLSFVLGSTAGAVGGGVIGYMIGLAMGYNQMPLSECLSLVHR